MISSVSIRLDISLVTIADQSGISVYMVSRLFKSQTGVFAITRKVGFENLTYFASLFRACYGVAPLKYRDDNISRK